MSASTARSRPGTWWTVTCRRCHRVPGPLRRRGSRSGRPDPHRDDRPGGVREGASGMVVSAVRGSRQEPAAAGDRLAEAAGANVDSPGAEDRAATRRVRCRERHAVTPDACGERPQCRSVGRRRELAVGRRGRGGRGAAVQRAAVARCGGPAGSGSRGRAGGDAVPAQAPLQRRGASRRGRRVGRGGRVGGACLCAHRRGGAAAAGAQAEGDACEGAQVQRARCARTARPRMLPACVFRGHGAVRP